MHSITDALLADLQNSVPPGSQQHQQTSHFTNQQQHSKSTINYGDSTSGYGSLRSKPTFKPASEVSIFIKLQFIYLKDINKIL